ncbi:hypothetical protein K5V07_05810 [Flavobacterium sp. CHNK8]|uniref:tetratricopeptide repeat protein n=1 Tax=Flavobacterium sp. CHNK8 TaxID=2871165 RepID=UPI001C8EEA01|nr:hypothetical protein [Flavobacterium sp. CHNK8]QZK90030.1 hypothetical protein K5V07_05810 [Flavobacterium sp. CHNK8]
METIIYEIERYITDNVELDLDYLKNVSDLHKNISELKVYYIFALFKAGQFKFAVKELDFFEQPKNLENDSFFLMTKCLIDSNKNGEIDTLINSLEKLLIVDKDKKNKWLRLELFKLYEKKGIDYLAWGYLEEAIAIDEIFYEAILARAYRLNLITNCSDIIQHIISLPQTYIDSEILNFLGNAYLNCGDTENALKIFNGSIKKTETEEAYYFLGYINHYNLNDFEKGLFYYDKSMSLNNKFIDSQLEKAWLLYDMERYESSETLFEEIIAEFEEVNAYNQIVLFYIKTNRYLEALKFIEESKIKFGPNYMNEGFELVCLQKKGDNAYLSKYSMYKNNYTTDELLWFKDMLSEI